MKVNKLSRPKGVSGNVTDNDGRHFVSRRQKTKTNPISNFMFLPLFSLLDCGLPLHYIWVSGPTKVMVNLYVRSFEKIDDVKMEFSVQITFRKSFSRSDNLKLKSDSRNPAKFDINGFQLPVVGLNSNLKIKMKRNLNISIQAAVERQPARIQQHRREDPVSHHDGKRQGRRWEMEG